MEKYNRFTKRTKYGIEVYDGEGTFIISCGGYATKEALNRLAELEDKLENGKLVELPCKVGDTVYRVMADRRIKQPYEYKVIGFWYSVNNECNYLHLGRYTDGVFVSFISVPFSEFNRMLFLTKEEAEKKVKELADG